MIGIVSAGYLAKELWLLNCRNWEPSFKIFNPSKKNVVIVEGFGEEVHGVSSQSLVARAVTTSSMDTEQGTIIPPNKEIQNFQLRVQQLSLKLLLHFLLKIFLIWWGLITI